MAVKFNKDAILKHHFWILLGIAVPLIGAGLFMLMGPVAAQIETDRKKADSIVKQGKSALGQAPFLNEENIKKKQAQVDALKKKENELWKSLFDQQAGMTFWPKAFEDAYPVNDGKFIREVKVADAAATDGDNQFTGKLVGTETNFIVVQGRDNKKELFYYMGDMKFDAGLSSDTINQAKGKDLQITYQTGLYFNDKLSAEQRALYAERYQYQLRPILDIVDPVNEEGDGVVILRDWPVPKKASELPQRQNVKFLRFAGPNWITDHDISEEAWVAQEDLWIQKEIYRIVRQANDYVGKLEGTPVAGFNQEAVFKNTYVELKLKLLSNDQLECTIKNLQDHRLKLEIKFRIRFDKDATVGEKVLVEGEPLEPAGTVDAKKKPKDSLTVTIDLPVGPKRTGIFGVEQALTWETAAVRRIDNITIGNAFGEEVSLNHRVFPDGVKPLVPEKKDPAAAEAPPELDNFGKPIKGPVPGQFPGRGVGPGGEFNPALHINGLLKERYSEEPNDQTRRLPVAVTLIVDQDHIDRVLTAFANSKLRFVVNQMLVNRYPLSVRPPVGMNDLIRAPGGFLPPRGPISSPPGPFGPGPGRPIVMPLPGAGMPGGMTGEEEVEANVELVLYGTVTFYQRFPARPKAAEPVAEAPKQ